MGGPILRWLTGKGLPRYPGVCAAEQVFAIDERSANVERGTSLARESALMIKEDEDNSAPHVESLPAPNAVGALHICRRGLDDVREILNHAPGQGTVHTFPQPRMSRTEIENVAIVRVNGHSFAIPATIFISAHLKREVCALE